MDSNQIEIISKKLDAIIALLAINNLGGKSKSDTIMLLHQLGLDNATVATIVNSTSGAVAVSLSKAKKNSNKSKKSGGEI